MLFICLITADVDEKSKHEILVYMAKETFVFAKSESGSPGEGGGGVWGCVGGEVEYRIPAYFSRESRIPNFCCRYIPNIVFSFFSFSVKNYQVITNGYYILDSNNAEVRWKQIVNQKRGFIPLNRPPTPMIGGISVVFILL